MSNKLLSPGKFTHLELFLFYLFRDEKELLSGFPSRYQNKLEEQEVQDLVNIYKIEFEPCGNLVDQVFLQLDEKLIND